MGVGLLTALVLVAGLVVGGLIRARPDWYRPEPMPEAARKAAAQALHNRILDLNNRVGDSIIESKQQSSQARAVKIEISEEELNAVYQTWEVLPGLDDQLDQFVTDRQIRLLPGRIVLAGRLARGGIVAGLHLVIEKDEQGLPVIFLEGINAGLMHIPDSMTDGPRRRMMASLERDIARRTPHIRFDPPNEEAIRVVMARQFSRISTGQRIQPMLVVQSGLGEGLVAEPTFANLDSLEIEDGKLTALLRPLTPDEARARARELGIIEPKRAK